MWLKFIKNKRKLKSKLNICKTKMLHKNRSFEEEKGEVKNENISIKLW